MTYIIRAKFFLMSLSLVVFQAHAVTYQGVAYNYFSPNEVFTVQFENIQGTDVRPNVDSFSSEYYRIAYGFNYKIDDWLGIELLGRNNIPAILKPNWYYGAGIPISGITVSHPLFDPRSTDAYLAISTGFRSLYSGLEQTNPNGIGRWILGVFDRTNPFLPELLLWGRLPSDLPITYWETGASSITQKFFDWFLAQPSWSDGVFKIQGMNLPVQVMAVPLPGSVWLFLSGLLMMSLMSPRPKGQGFRIILWPQLEQRVVPAHSEGVLRGVGYCEAFAHGIDPKAPSGTTPRWGVPSPSPSRRRRPHCFK